MVINILYAYPERVTDEVIDAMVRNEKVCRYLDVPVQHISDKVLKNMRRTVNKEKIVSLFKKLKDNGFTIRSTFIVGFPMEDEDDFEQLVEFTENAKIDRLGVFPYSMEENTPAADMEQVDDDIKQRRFEEIMAIQSEISKELNEARIGKTYKVLIEGIEEGIYTGIKEILKK